MATRLVNLSKELRGSSRSKCFRAVSHKHTSTIRLLSTNSESSLGKLKVNEELDQILNHFHAPIRFACGYGSGVFKQAGYTSKDKPQVDLIFGVTHPQHWHSQNFKHNSHHYSGMRYLGSGFVSYVQDKFGAGIYYNPYCEIGGLKVKYGVVSVEKLVDDLVRWNTLYLAGRMQKPLKILRDDPHVKIANQINRSIALRASILMLPEKFSLEELYLALVGISYMGDFRMAFGENPNKVANIVKAQRTFLEEIYHPVIDAFPNLTRTGECIVQDVSPKIATLTIKKLPEKFRNTLETEYRMLTNTPYGKEVEYSRGPHLTKATSQALTKIVGEAALTQSVKGFFTAGLTRSFRYVGEKVYKRFK